MLQGGYVISLSAINVKFNLLFPLIDWCMIFNWLRYFDKHPYNFYFIGYNLLNFKLLD